MAAETALTVHRGGITPRGMELTTLEQTVNLGRILAKSGYFKDAMDESKAVVKILAGAEVGIPPIAAMKGIHVIEGKPSFSAGTMAALVKRAGYRLRVIERSAAAARIEFMERIDGRWESLGTAEFTIQDAGRAGLNGRPIWKSYPANMLFARAMSTGVNMFCQEVFLGPVYTPEELGAEVTSDGDVIETDAPQSEPPPQQDEDAQQSERTTPTKKQAREGFVVDACMLGIAAEQLKPKQITEWVQTITQDIERTPEEVWNDPAPWLKASSLLRAFHDAHPSASVEQIEAAAAARFKVTKLCQIICSEWDILTKEGLAVPAASPAPLRHSAVVDAAAIFQSTEPDTLEGELVPGDEPPVLEMTDLSTHPAKAYDNANTVAAIVGK